MSKRIRLLRLQKNITQQQLEELADLPLKYTYKLENLKPNIKIKTLEKIMDALDTDIESFFDISLTESNPLINQLLFKLEELSPSKQERVTKLLIHFLDEIEK
ncbi:helix-turn-helix domain-containing protein [Streptococcus sp. DD10]|uniref:helix-turn-helix domain-containing protein n=1 Tax=Streptococcus sp. DD10 TaxID=1777878 RepID=UPI0012E804CA|nr:helix-turn-helix transcriptional regulator [Streptococcus sp. DD10]